MTGRPTSFTPEQGDLICSLLMEGKSLRQIATLDTMPAASTILLWVAKGARGDEMYRAFSEQYAHAMHLRADYWNEDIIDIADHKGNDFKKDASGNPVFDDAGNPVIDHDNIQRAKLQIEARKWLMGKQRPKKYGDKLQTELTGKDGGPIVTESAVKVYLPDNGRGT